jgi:hypothetical protein
MAGCLILGVGFCNIYLAFLHTKSLKNSSRGALQLLVHFFISLLFSVTKASFAFRCLLLPFAFQLKKQAEQQKQTGPKQTHSTDCAVNF